MGLLDLAWAPRRLSLSLREGAASGFVTGVSLTLGARLFGLVVGVLTLTATTRLLGPEGRGQFAVVMTTLALVLQFSNFGLHASSTYHLSRHPELRGAVGGLLVWCSLAGVGLLAAAAYLLAALAPSVISVPLPLLGIALLGAPPAMFVLLASNALLGLGSTTWYNGLDLATKLIGVVSVALLIWWSLPVFFGGYAALHWVLAGVAYAHLLGRRRPGWPDVPLVRGMFGYGLRAFLAALFMYLAMRVNLFLVNAWLGTADAGQYSVAMQVGEILSLLTTSIAAMLFPRLAAMPRERRWPAALRVARITALLLGIGAVGLALVSRPAFVTLFGAAFEPAVVVLWWLLPGLWCLGVNTVLYQHLAASGMPWFLVWATSGAAVVNVVLSVELIPAFGIAGAAVASSVTYAGLLLSTLGYSTLRAAANWPGAGSVRER